MKLALAIAKDLLLKPASLDESRIEKLIRSMLSNRVDAADLYFQSCKHIDLHELLHELMMEYK